MQEWMDANKLNAYSLAEKLELKSPQSVYYQVRQKTVSDSFKHRLLSKGFHIFDKPETGNIMLHSNGIDAGTHITIKESPDFIDGYMTLKGIGQNDGAWLVTGHSMYPTVSKGSRVILRKIENLNLIVFGEIYAVDLREHGGKLKRIKKGRDAEHWVLYSDNTDYEPFEVNIKRDVMAVFRVLCCVENF